jgi:hypothetical protein
MSSCCSDLQDFGCGGSPKCQCFFPFVFIFFLGGYLLYAWEYMANHGLASEDCIPYASGSGHPPTCPSTCADNRTITRTAALLSSVAYSGSATQLQNEILTNGPIQVFMPMNAFAACCLVFCCFFLILAFRLDSTFTTTFLGLIDSALTLCTLSRIFSHENIFFMFPSIDDFFCDS